jgi:uncharacterized protein
MQRAHLLAHLGLGLAVAVGLTIDLPSMATLAAPRHTPAAEPTPSTAPAAADCGSAREVQVSGAATVNVVPNRALIKIGVQSNSTTPDAALNDNKASVARVIEAVQGLSSVKIDVDTDHYMVYPVYEEYADLTIKGYRVDNVIAVTLYDPNRASNVLVAAFGAGANQVLDVQFYTSELRRHRDKARDMAMQAAGEKAQALARAGGAQAGCLLKISENSWYSYSGTPWGPRDRALWSQNVVAEVAPGEQPSPDGLPIRVGVIAVRAEVGATFSLR